MDVEKMTVDPRDVSFVFPWTPGSETEILIDREWLVTNGLGGYASGTLLGVSTRRYHGLFIPNLPSPRGRTVFIPRFDEEISVNGRTILMGGSEFQNGRFDGHAAKYLKEFKLAWQIPTWTFEIEGITLQKRISMVNGYNMVCVEYHLLKGNSLKIGLRPYVTCRGHDDALVDTSNWAFTAILRKRFCEIRPYDNAPSMKMAMRPHQGVFMADSKEVHGAFYRVEEHRGLDHIENLYSPGHYEIELFAGEPVAFVATTDSADLMEFELPSLFEAERARMEHLLSRTPKYLQSGLGAHLVLAADQFITLPGSRVEENVIGRATGDESRTVIAGYHWFTDWGRDTMISLEGLALCTGRLREARAILLTFSHYIKDGLIPNQFPEGGKTGIYNTVDATLWYFHAIDRYYQKTGDADLIKILFPKMKSIVDQHVTGTVFNIGVDPEDGLLREGMEGYALTWMDAKVDTWVVTPRAGKPVEIQALWYNALRLIEEWAKLLNEGPEPYAAMAERVSESFNKKFWFEPGHYLYDVIGGVDGPDSSLRPNQIFSMSLKHPVLAKERWQLVLGAVTEHLLTPVGLRTLNKEHKDYRPKYVGNRWERDAAYHQGLVWAWLIGHYADAWKIVFPGQPLPSTLIEGFVSHLRDAGVGSMSEIFDAEYPFTPRGCIAQAWSVAETLRILCSGIQIPS